MAEKKKYWLKIEKDFLKSSQIKVIKNLPNGKDYLLFYLAIMLESTETIGHLRFSELIPYNEEMLASVTDTNIDIVRSAIKVFSSLGLLQVLEDGTIFLPDVPKRTGKESDSTERVRTFRARNSQKELNCGKMDGEALHCNANVTQDCYNVQKCNDNKEKEKEKEENKEKDKEEDKEREKEETPGEAAVSDLFNFSLAFDEPLKFTLEQYRQAAEAANNNEWLQKNYKHISKIHKFYNRIVTGYYDKYGKTEEEDHGKKILDARRYFEE